MSGFEILNYALLNTIVQDNLTVKANSNELLSLIISTSNELKDMINRKANAEDVLSLVSGNSNEVMNMLSGATSDINDRLRISVYNIDNIQSNIRFSNIENTKATIANTQLTGVTNIEALRASGNIYTEGTIIASNLRIIGDTSIINTVTTLTDQVLVENDGTDSALIVKQFGNQNIAEFYNSTQLLTVIDKNGKIGINTLPRYELDIMGSSYITNMYGDSSKTTIDGVFIEDIFTSNTNLINYLRNYTEHNFDIIESNIKIITNTVNYGTDQFINSISNNNSQFIANKIISLEARIAYLEQQLL